jgi:hypothetical protein
MKTHQTPLAAAFLLFLASPIAAQQRPDGAFQRLEAGQRMRIETAERGRIEGRFERISPDLLSVELAEEPSVLIKDIDAFRVRHGSRAGTGFVVGGVIGGLLGATAGAGWCAAIDSSECSTAGAATVLGLVGAAGFGLVGALIGTAVPRWRLQYERIPQQ